MLHDEVSLEVKSDALICEYGDRLLEKQVVIHPKIIMSVKK